jgi:hypothetical protein
MLRKPVFAVAFVTVYLALYCIFFIAGYHNIIAYMFMLSPILVIWMVISILKYGKYSSTELKPNEEWGYEDKKREEC